MLMASCDKVDKESDEIYNTSIALLIIIVIWGTGDKALFLEYWCPLQL